MFFGNALCFLDGKGRGTVRADMAEINKPLDARLICNLCEHTRAFNVCTKQIAAPSLRTRTGEMVNLVHAAQGGMHTACVIQADNCHFHGNTTRQTRRIGRGTQEYAHLFTRFR